MITKLNLETEANSLATKANGKAVLDTKFNQEYIITNIDEDILTEEGYKYIGDSEYTQCPIFQKENIYGIFIDNSFRLGEGLLTTEEELRKEEEGESEG